MIFAVVVAPAGSVVAISGRLALDKHGNVVGAGDSAQSVGLAVADVTRTDMYATDLKNLSVLREVRARPFRSAAPASHCG